MGAILLDIIKSIDISLFRFINCDMHNKLLDFIMPIITTSEYWRVPMLIGYIVLAILGHKKGRETWFKNLQNHESVIVFYESVHRVKNCLERVSDLCPDRPMILARELTKKFETIYRGTASGILNELPLDETKGEFVVVLDRTR